MNTFDVRMKRSAVKIESLVMNTCVIFLLLLNFRDFPSSVSPSYLFHLVKPRIFTMSEQHLPLLQQTYVLVKAAERKTQWQVLSGKVVWQQACAGINPPSRRALQHYGFLSILLGARLPFVSIYTSANGDGCLQEC